MPRSTKDADVVVHVASERWAKFPGMLPEGIELDAQMGFEMVTSSRREILRVAGTPFEIELFKLSDDPHDREWFARRVSEEVFPGERIFLPTAEDVIVQKLRWSAAAKRPKDFFDVVAVMQVQWKKLDWPYIEKWCAEHGTLEVLEKAKDEASVAWGE